MKTDKFTQIRKDLDAALEAVCEKHGLTVKQGSITYNELGFKMALTFGNKGAIGDSDPVYAQDLRKYGPAYGLSMSDMGKKFSLGIQGEAEIVGMKRRKVVGRHMTSGKLYLYPAELVGSTLS